MASARWIQCESITSELGFLAKHPTTGAAIQSPYVAIANTYMTQANRLWSEIFQIVRENCTGEYAGSNPQDDVMERLLRARKGNGYEVWPYDGKYIKDGEKLVICQSNARSQHLREVYPTAEINPLGDWTGGTDVDTGATNRKLGSDMADSVTGGGLHGKDLSKADVSVNIYAWLKAQLTGKPVELCCAIGDDTVDGIPYSEIVETARNYIKSIGGFEKFAEWGLV